MALKRKAKWEEVIVSKSKHVKQFYKRKLCSPRWQKYFLLKTINLVDVKVREYNLKHQTHSHVHRRLLPVPSQGFFGMWARFTKEQWSMKFILVVPFVECAKRPPLLFECL